jgi:hypothetical protein
MEKRKNGMPSAKEGLNELAVHLGHYAGALEGCGVFKYEQWEGLVDVINKIIAAYYDEEPVPYEGIRDYIDAMADKIFLVLYHLSYTNRAS